MNRWLRISGALLMPTCFGITYVWSIFITPLQAEFGWSRADISFAQTISIVCIAVSASIGGRWQDRAGPAGPALAGAFLFGAGLLLAGFAKSRSGLYLAYGVMTGFGGGIGYSCPISVGMKWFPDRRGLVAGLMVTGYGAGAALFAPVAEALVRGYGWRAAFQALGVVSLAVLSAGSFFLRNPPAGWRPAGWNPARPETSAASPATQYAPAEMAATAAFARLWTAYALGAAAGLMVIAHLAALAKGELMLSAESAALAVSVLALGNGAGRLGSGWLSDHLGRIRTLALSMASTAAVLFACWLLFFHFGAGARLPLFAAVFLVGYGYGSQLAVFPAATAELFGMKHLGNNYGLLFLAWGLAGVMGPMLAGKVFDLRGSYGPAFLIAAAMALAAAIIVSGTRPPPRGRAPRPAPGEPGRDPGRPSAPA